MSDGLIVLFLAAAAIAVAVGLPYLSRRHGDRVLEGRGVAEGLGFDGTGESETLVHEHVDGFDVKVVIHRESSGDSRRVATRLIVDGRGRVPPEMALSKGAGWQGFDDALDALGEDGFARSVRVSGPPDLTLAALGAEARTLVAEHLACGGLVVNGNVALEWPEEVRDRDVIGPSIRSMVQLARALCADSIPASLAANARTDPNPRMRRRLLAELATRYAHTAQAGEAFAAALEDPDPEVRMTAALNLPGGDLAQRALERLVEDEGLGALERARALERLSEVYSYAEIAPFVARALTSGAQALRVAAVVAVGQGRDAGKAGALREMAATSDEGLGFALAGALGRLGGPEAEAGLLVVLGHPSSKARRAAAEALSAVGTVRAVEPLLALTEGVFGDAAVRQAALEAARAIQARLGDAEGGRLSVVEPVGGEGGLSLGPAKAKVDGGG